MFAFSFIHEYCANYSLYIFFSSPLCYKCPTRPIPVSRIDISQGLSNNEINCVLKDEKGFMWFGTRSGLDRFDGYNFKIFKHDLRDTTSLRDEEIDRIFEGPHHKLWIVTKSSLVIYDLLTEKFDNHPQALLQRMGIPDATLTDLEKDDAGNFWFLCTDSGLYKYDPVRGKTLHFENKEKDASISITGFTLADKGYVWLVKNTGLLKKLDKLSGRTIFTTDVVKKVSKDRFNYAIYMDAQNDLWVYASRSSQGVFYYNTTAAKTIHISRGNDGRSLNNDVVRGIVQDKDGLMWIATDHGGINLLDKKDFSVKYLMNHEDDNYSIAQNSINSMYRDDNGIIWIGTFKKGLSYYHKNIIKFPLYRNKLSDPNSLPFNDVNRFVEDAKGNIWIGTNGGGLIYFDRKNNKFTRYTHNASNPNSLCTDVIVSLCLDHEQKLWIGTYFGGLDHFDGTNFKHYRHNDNDPASLSDNSVWSLMEDSQQRLWIGTFSSGLDYLDKDRKNFKHFRPTGYHSVHSGYISDLMEARNGDIWIATSYGVDVVQGGTDVFSQYYHHADTKPANSLSNDNTIALLQDTRGIIWVATREGLDFYDASKAGFTTLRKEDGLPDNIILSIAEDGQHNLWVGTPNGLSNVIVNTDNSTGKLSFQFRNFNESDGLQGKEFNEFAAYATREGELAFGGAYGFNLFTPQQINSSSYDPQLVLTDLQMFNKSVNVGEQLNGHVILPQSISETKSIALKYNENIFSIEFASLNFFNTSKFKYAYKLENFNNEWFIADDKTRKATYTNLDPGNYTFYVRTISENGSWSKQGILLNVEILPPIWRTPAAYILYFLVLIASLYFARRMIILRARTRYAIEEERREAHRLHELDMMKIRFFTNLSHDFRTPLSLIITPMDKIIKNANEPSQKHQFQMIHRNARRLLNLVNQLLDFRKMEMRELKLNPSKGDIVKFIKDLSYSFTDLAEKNNIKFAFHSSIQTLIVLFDHDKIERVIFNLLSNAFKFTPEHGHVSVELNSRENDDITMLEIKVTDTGIGIAREKQDKIFERFFQNEVPGNMVNQGSGIGLAITREFVKLHNGSITLESEQNKGSCFTLQLPFKELAESFPEKYAADEIIDEDIEPVPEMLAEEYEPENIKAVPQNGVYSVKKPIVLIIEDNEDLRFYLKENLQQFFNIAEAANGKTGWQKALSLHPDIVVSDINMPEMNGVDLCRKIKSDKRTSFIPVILLTAISGEDQQLKGLETGASDYVTKPFNFEILLFKIKNLLVQQDTVKRTYQKQVIADPSAIQIGSPDEKFVQDALRIIEKNIANPDLSVEELGRELFMSRVALYKKMLAITGKTPIEFIRSTRLKRAAQLLEKSKLSIAEVAYEVGFNNPKYFSKFFKTEFNMLPSAYQAEKRKQQASAGQQKEDESQPPVV